MNKARIPNKVGTIFGSYNPLTCSSLNKNMKKQLRDNKSRFTSNKSKIYIRKGVEDWTELDKFILKTHTTAMAMKNQQAEIPRIIISENYKPKKLINYNTLGYCMTCCAISGLIIYTIFQ